MSLAMSECRGVSGVAGYVRKVKCAHLVLGLEESELRGVPGIASDVQAPRSPWRSGEQSDQLVDDEVCEPSGPTS